MPQKLKIELIYNVTVSLLEGPKYLNHHTTHSTWYIIHYTLQTTHYMLYIPHHTLHTTCYTIHMIQLYTIINTTHPCLLAVYYGQVITSPHMYQYTND